jgi:hypothetical protein
VGAEEVRAPDECKGKVSLIDFICPIRTFIIQMNNKKLFQINCLLNCS